MVRQHLIDKGTYRNIIDPVKEIVTEYNEYMKDVTSSQIESDNLTYIGKSLLLLKDYMSIEYEKAPHLSKLIISDLNSCLYCIKYKLPKRFFYFAYRSAIEAFLRLNVTCNEERNLERVFNCFKEENDEAITDNMLYKNFYANLKNEYRKSSGYVHGDEKLKFTLKESIEIINEIESINSNIDELVKLINLFKKFYLVRDDNLQNIKHLYRFKIPALKYLLTKQEIEYLL